MARRSDHTRDELRALFLDEGHRQMAAEGFHGFSARAVAKAVGYSIGTLYNVFGTLDALLVAINTRTFTQWTDDVRARLAAAGPDRIEALVRAYFGFAQAHPKLWMAIYDYRLPDGGQLPDADAAERGKLVHLVAAEVGAHLGWPFGEELERLTRSLIATVHGHCSLALGSSFALMGESDPVARALDRVRDSLDAAARRT